MTKLSNAQRLALHDAHAAGMFAVRGRGHLFGTVTLSTAKALVRLGLAEQKHPDVDVYHLTTLGKEARYLH